MMPIALMADRDDVRKAYDKALKTRNEEGTFTLVVKHKDKEFAQSILWLKDCIGWLDHSDSKNDYFKFLTTNSSQDLRKILEKVISEQNLSGRITASQFATMGMAYVINKNYRQTIWTGVVDDQSTIHGHGYGFGFSKGMSLLDAIIFEGTFNHGVPQGKLDVIYRAPVEYGVGMGKPSHTVYNVRNEEGILCYESENKDRKDLAYYKKNNKIFSGSFLSYDDYDGVYRKAVYPDGKVIYISRKGETVEGEIMALRQKAKETKNKDPEDYSTIPDYPMTDNVNPNYPKLWRQWFTPRQIMYMDQPLCAENQELWTACNDKIKDNRNRLYPDDQIETCCQNGIMYFCYANGEAKANGYGLHFNKLTGVIWVNNNNYYSTKECSKGNIVIPPTITSEKTKKTYTVTAIGTFEGLPVVTVIIPKTVRKMGRPNAQGILVNVFANCKELQKVVVEEGNPGINWGDCAFEGCTQLADIPVNFSSAQVNDGMFKGCTKLTTVKLPVGIKQMGEKCFAGCTALETLTIPNTCTSIDEHTFDDMPTMKTALIPVNIYRQLQHKRDNASYKRLLATSDFKIRDEKYQPLSQTELYQRESLRLEAYCKELAAKAIDYQHVKINDDLVDQFINTYESTSLDTKDMVSMAKTLKREHHVIRVLCRPDDGGYVAAFDQVKNSKRYGFESFHQQVLPLLTKNEQKYNDKKLKVEPSSGGSSSINPNTVSIPSYKADNYGNNGFWHSNGDPTQKKVIKFSTGEKITLYRRPDSTRGWIYYPIEYGIDLLGPGWKTEEDAAAAGYVSRKYSKIRTIGRYTSF